MASNGGGGLKGFLFKINTSIGNVEKTKMTPEFNQSVERFESYRDRLEPLVDKLEGAIQHNPNVLLKEKIVSAPGENPHEQLSASMEIFKTYQTEDRQTSINQLIAQRNKLAACQRDGQLKGRRAIRHLRRFFGVEYKKMREENDALTKIRNHMDMIKHDVKTSKNTEQIEKFALLYEEAVENFDQQAKRVIDLLETMPTIQKSHIEGINEYFEVLQKNNEEMASIVHVPLYK